MLSAKWQTNQTDMENHKANKPSTCLQHKTKKNAINLKFVLLNILFKSSNIKVE